MSERVDHESNVVSSHEVFNLFRAHLAVDNEGTRDARVVGEETKGFEFFLSAVPLWDKTGSGCYGERVSLCHFTWPTGFATSFEPDATCFVEDDGEGTKDGGEFLYVDCGCPREGLEGEDC